MKIKRFLAIILAIVMIISTMSIPSFAIDDIDNSISESSDTTNITDEQESSEESTEESSEEFSEEFNEESSEESSEEFYEEFNLENDLPANDVVATVNDDEYATIKEAINAAQSGDTVIIKEGTYAVPSMKAGITVVGEGDVLLEGTLSGTLENLTLKNLHIKGGNAQRWAYAKGDLVFDNVTFEATSVYALHFDGISSDATLLYKNCTIIGWAAMGGSPASCVFDGCTIKDNGTYGVIRTYFDAEINNCTFDVDGADTEDAYQDGIHAVGATINVNDCTNANGDMMDILNISGESYIYVDGVLVLATPKTYEVATKAELDAAIAAAIDGDTILLTNNIDYGNAQLKIEKAITLDLGTQILTNSFGYGGISLKNNPTVKNGTIDHKGGVAAIKAWNVAALEDLIITVAERPGKTVGGIVIQEGSEVKVGTIKNVTINGAGLTNGIETYNCGTAAENVIGSMENVTIDAVGTGMLISAPCGTATNCNIKGGTTGIEIWIKGTYSATLDLEGCTVEGGEQAFAIHDEYNSNPGIVNNGLLKLTADDNTTFTSDSGRLLKYTIARAENVEISENILKFKPLDGSGTEKDPFVINNVNELIWFRNDVNAGNTYEGKYVLLTSDIDLEGYKETNVNHEGNNVSSSTFRPIADKASGVAFKGTFDGGDHTISNLYISGWDINYHWDSYGQAALFGTIENATIMNLTVEGFEIQVEGGDVAAIAGHAIGNCTFENITVTDSKIATYNNGCAGIVAWTEDGDYTFKNINITDSVVLAGLWGSFDSSIGGVVSQAEPGAAYNFENVNIACRLDVYNDCTASYDYYNYRMCGMIIGRLEKTITVDGKAYPDMSKYDITCEDVTVYMGEWANYHYCEPTPGYNNGRGMRVEPGYTYDGLPADYDHSQCTTNHMTVIPFTSLFGGAQYGVKGNTKEDLAKLGFFDGEKNKEEGIVVIDYSLPARSVAEVEGEYFDDLQKAIDAVNGNGTVNVINNTSGDVTVSAPEAVLLADDETEGVIIEFNDFIHNGTITVAENAVASIKNGTIINEEGSNSAIESVGTTTIENVDIESARHGVRVEGGLTTINGGSYSIIGSGKTQHAVNVSDGGAVVIYDGTFTGPKGTTADSGSAVCVQAGSTVTIYGGKFINGKNSTLEVKENANLKIYGGTFDQDPTDYVAEGTRAIEDKGNGYWVVLPAGVHSIELSVDNAEKTYYFEDTITLDVTVNGGAYAVSDWTLTYDTEKLEYIGTVQLDGDSKAAVVNETIGTITEENYSNKIGGDLFADGSKVTYTFKVKAPVEDTTALFKITAATVDTVLTSAYGKTDVNTPELTVNIKLREIVEITKADNGTEFTDEPYVFTHDEKDHVITVDAEDIDGETITYKLDGTSVDEVKINAAGTYVVEYTITKAGYDTVTDTITITVEKAEFTNVIVKDGDDTTITVDPYSFAFDNTDHVITVDADGVEGESIVYTLNGEEVAEISLKAVGTYEIGYTITKDSYTTYTGTLKVVITNPEFVIETSVYTLNDHTLVMLYTTADGMYPKLGSDAMFDITAAGYEYQENEDSTPVPYAKVYGIVLPKAEAADLEALRASITFSTKKPFVIDPYDNDVTFDSQVNSRDIVIAVNVYNDYEDIHGKYDMMSRILKSDVTGDKKVDIADVTAIEAEIYG